MPFSRINDSQFELNPDDEHGGVAAPEPLSHRRPQTARNDEQGEVSAVFRMRPARIREAALKAAWGLLSGMLGGFLLAQIPDTPGLALNIAVIAGLGIIGAVVLFVMAVREFTSRLMVDRRGIAWLPAWAGFRMNWDDIESWEMTDETGLPSNVQQLKLFRFDSKFPTIVDTSWMSIGSRSTLRRVLCEVAREKNGG